MKDGTYMKPWDGVFLGNEYEDEELRHTYWKNVGKKQKQFFGITSVVGWALPSYGGVSKQTLMKAAEFGSSVHEEIEAYEMWGGEADSNLLQMYQQCKDENKLNVICTEFLVSDNSQFASAIDCIADTPDCEDNEVVLIDFKSTADRMEEKVTLQLSFYAEWFERQTGLKVKGLYHMWFKKEKVDGVPQVTGVEYNQVGRVDSRQLAQVIKHYKINTTYTKQGKLLIPESKADEKWTYNPYPQDLLRKAKSLNKMNQKLTEMQAELEQYKSIYMEELRQRGYHTIKDGNMTISRMAGKVSTRFDKSKLMAEHPEIVMAQYETKSIGKESLTIRYNNK